MGNMEWGNLLLAGKMYISLPYFEEVNMERYNNEALPQQTKVVLYCD